MCNDTDTSRSKRTRWLPVAGVETTALLERLKIDQDGRTLLVDEATNVLSQCVPPSHSNGADAGLVIGYVQSGKTASFTTVAALAHDSGYQVVIVLSGLTSNLFEQSYSRLTQDLGTSESRYRWLALANPKKSDLEQLRVGLSQHEFRPASTLLLTIMKNRAHLNNLNYLLERLSLEGVPCLVIDDEADQASLNNEVRQAGESATYQRILEIRSRLPHHTYLQYTATPQAPLLISLVDLLSPSFAEVLTPGSAYTGGATFFGDDRSLIRAIPIEDIPDRDDALDAPPESLEEALKVYWLGVAIGMTLEQHLAKGNRSMMVHPAKYRDSHERYHIWVKAISKNYIEILRRADRDGWRDPDYRLFTDDFERVYLEFLRAEPELPAFDEVLKRLPVAIQDSVVTVVNSSKGKTPQPNWHQHYAHILIGGEVLNRGFTVEGLTVTYMPRSLGSAQADTIQQRARWFGYKQDSLFLCRVYLTHEANAAYQAYLVHEEQMRKSLKEFASCGRHLREWKRAFLLESSLQPTRRSVFTADLVRDNFAGRWFITQTPHESSEFVALNREVMNVFFDSTRAGWVSRKTHPDQTDDQVHSYMENRSVAQVYRELLAELQFSGEDGGAFTGLLLQMRAHLDENVHGPVDVLLVRIRQGATRRRSLDSNGRIDNLFQGAYPSVDTMDHKQGSVYKGDRYVRAKELVTIQLHSLDIFDEGKLAASSVPAIAVHLPKTMSLSWLVARHDES